MSEAAHNRIEGLIHQHFAGKLSSEAYGTLRTHLRQCEHCERVYERYASAERGLYHTEDEALTAASLGRMQTALFDAPAPAAPRPPWWARTPMVFAALGAVVFLFMLRPEPTQDTLQARGAAVAPAPGISFRVLRLRSEGGKVKVQDLGTKDAQLKAGDQVILLYTNLSGAKSAQVILRSEQHAKVVLVPRHALKTEVEDARFGPPLIVDETWPMGSIQIEAQFEGPDQVQHSRSVPVRRVKP